MEWRACRAAFVALAIASACGDVSSGDGGPLGPCVDPHADAARRLSAGDDRDVWLQELETLDLDRDGRRDLLVADWGRCGSGGCNPWLIYVRKGSCAHYVGAAMGQELKSLGTTHAGLLDVAIESHAGYCPFSEYELRFDGRAYALTRSRWCACDAEDSKGVRCDPWK
jgi:hypothetical protein